MSELNETNIIEELLQTVPEIKNSYIEEIKCWDGEFPGLHNIFGDIFDPFLNSLLNKNENEELIQRLFDFMESMSKSMDEYIKNVLFVTVLESLGDDKIIYNTSLKYMGDMTKKLSIKVEKGLDRYE